MLNFFLQLDRHGLAELFRALETIDPWRRLGLTEAGMMAELADDSAMTALGVRGDDGAMGAGIVFRTRGAAGALARWKADGKVARAEYPADGGYVHDLGTLPDHRGRGIGPALLREAERRSAAAGAGAMYLFVSWFNDDAVRFYIREGYACLGFVPDVLFPGHVEFLMAKRLRGWQPLPAAHLTPAAFT